MEKNWQENERKICNTIKEDEVLRKKQTFCCSVFHRHVCTSELKIMF